MKSTYNTFDLNYQTIVIHFEKKISLNFFWQQTAFVYSKLNNKILQQLVENTNHIILKLFLHLIILK